MTGGIIIVAGKHNKVRRNRSRRFKTAKPKDSISKIIFQNSERFAEVFNKSVFKENYLKPQDLSDGDTTEVTVVDGKAVQKYRDVIKKVNKGETFAILGIENQSNIDYLIPLRVLFYDCINYFKQCDIINQNRRVKLKGDEFLSNFSKDDKLIPVITLVIYYGDDKWNGPRSLKDMLKIKDEVMERFVYNIPIYLIDVKHLEKEEIDRYDGSIKALFGFLAYDKNKEALLKFIEENQTLFNDLPKDISEAINIFSRVKLDIGQKYETDSGGVDMCKAIEDLRNEERNIGLQKGESIGLQKGIQQMIKSMLEMGISEEKVQEIVKNMEISKA